jgi:hypothetical protein
MRSHLWAVAVAVIVAIIIPFEAQSATIWPATMVPGIADSGPDSAVELGVKFRSDSNGSISGVRFYKASANSGTHTGSLWSSSGTRLATATFRSETASGWQQVNFATPVAISANTVYIASYHTNSGHYSCDQNFFASSGADSPPLHALANGVSGVNGVYAYGSGSSYPSLGWNSSNYLVDVVFSATTSSDTTAPTVSAFTVPGTASTLSIVISSLSATDNVGVTGYLVNESATKPAASASGWTTSAPTSYSCSTAGSKTLYAWAKDAAGNVSASRSATVNITLSDSTAPAVSAFTVPATASSLTVAITSLTATDNVAVTGYLVNESSTKPSASTTGWTTSVPTSYSFTTAGNKTLYAWAKDAAGNVSASRSAAVVITVQSTGLDAPGWYAGDMHVHRSCGGTPETVTSLFQKMIPNKLTVISLLADMGNGEVQNPSTDLPLVTGKDASVSKSGQILHWDAEWHWDAIYGQYAHQALGGHVLALGLLEAHQIWEEYTYPIFNWAHQQNAIGGFAHMQYLTNGIPQSLDCCTPLEYPVEVALGSADFIEEDVDDINYNASVMYPENAIQAYYRLLNCGFRPGLAAGTDYPCNSGENLGSLLTYVQVAGGQMTYRNWIDGIAAGRTVVSRNGHNEFLNLMVNGSATPGDEVKLSGGGSVQVTVTWTTNQNLSGTIELVSNGVVVASKQASAASESPASLSATVNFTKSGWLAARRMQNNEHQLHTAAVFVTVDNAPVRASAEDAQFYVQWIDNLLTKTSPGGAWSSYFVNSRSAAQARYQSAKAIYQQIALEAGTTPLPSNGTIFSSQIPGEYENDADYELGTRFWADVNGQITQVRVYTNAVEGGVHTVRIWRASDQTVVSGPHTWNISSGSVGWKSFTLPTALNITANTDYIVSISNSSDRYYASQQNGCATPIVNGHLHTYQGSGVYSTVLGTMPTLIWNNSNYFRDVQFSPQ